MTKRHFYGGVTGVSLALAIMPAAACPRQIAAPLTSSTQRVQVIATADGYAIAARGDVPVASAAHQTVPLGAQMQIDRDAFECSTRRFASARR